MTIQNTVRQGEPREETGDRVSQGRVGCGREEERDGDSNMLVACTSLLTHLLGAVEKGNSEPERGRGGGVRVGRDGTRRGTDEGHSLKEYVKGWCEG